MNNVVPTRGELLDLFWRSIWTGLAALGGFNIYSAIAGLDISVLHSAGAAFTSAVLGVITVYARQKAGTVPSASTITITPPADAE
jgi:hypothetical protein